MNKSRYRYSHNAKVWTEVFRFNTDARVISSMRPVGWFNSFSAIMCDRDMQAQRKRNYEMAARAEAAHHGILPIELT